MAFEYTLTKVSALGEEDETYGQRWWCSAVGSDLEISFNTKNTPIYEGSTITAEEKVIKMTRPKEDKPSREYIQLKKVKVVGGQTPANAHVEEHVKVGQSNAPLNDPMMQALDIGTIQGQLQRIEDRANKLLEKVDKLLGLDEPGIDV